MCPGSRQGPTRQPCRRRHRTMLPGASPPVLVLLVPPPPRRTLESSSERPRPPPHYKLWGTAGRPVAVDTRDRKSVVTPWKAASCCNSLALRVVVLYVIFLDLHKAYDALDRSRCLEILEGYSIGLQARKLLKKYWYRLAMVARAGGYYGTAFRGTAGRPASRLSPP